MRADNSTTSTGPTGVGNAPLVEVVGLTKRFGALVANDNINLSVAAGEVHALLGENGAGKSTLTRVLYGLSQPDEGELRVDGRAVRFGSPKDAMRAGIGLVTQEFSLVGPMTVTENVMLATVGLGIADRRAARASVLEAASRIGVGVDPDAKVETLSVGERQRVEILKALYHDCRLLILDEPTAVLVPNDVHALFATVRRLTASGLGVVFISHKLHEVVDIADRITVLRRGRVVATQPAVGLDPATIATLMIGSDLATLPEAAELVGLPTTGPVDDDSAAPAAGGVAPVLAVRKLSLDADGVRLLDDVSVDVAPGEIVGVAGVSGNGQTELVSVLSAMTAPTAGTIHVSGVDVTGLDPTGRIRAGLGRMSEDRRGCVVPGLTVEQNLVLEDLDQFRRWGFAQRRRIRDHTRRLMEQFDIRAEPNDTIRSLSGGNVQKVLLARALSRRPAALVVAQPTRGLDVGASAYVHEQLRAVRDRRGGVLLVSEDLDELIALADRFVVLYSGRVIGELAAADATPETLGLLMTGHRSLRSPATPLTSRAVSGRSSAGASSPASEEEF
ncbi:MAG: ABC transporter ATP-binding protein [Actinomycetota bacterium]|nr:ABC transporter ATP-binding protein [Actinomycetota bacterium]